MVSRFGCFVFEFWVLRFRVLGASFSIDYSWVLRFRVLGASFSSFGCFVFEIWVLLASVFVFECFVFETTPKIKRLYPIKGRTPLIETQTFLRNKSTIVFQNCNLNNRQSLIHRDGYVYVQVSPLIVVRVTDLITDNLFFIF